MKWLYIAFDVDENRFQGVIKKIQWQAKAISTYSGCCDILLILGSKYKHMTKEQCLADCALHDYKDETVFSRILGSYQYLYFRYAGNQRVYNSILKNKEARAIKIVEIPTYPIRSEYIGRYKTFLKSYDYITALKKLFAAYYLGSYLLRCQNKHTDYCVLTSDGTVNNVPTINIENGIDVDSIPEKLTGVHKSSVSFIAVANVAFWHGYDRVLQGLADYHGPIEVSFTIVGEGADLSHLKALTEKYGISEKVHFAGLKSDKELDECFNTSDIAVGSLGLHRISIKTTSLKSREYCARGIPLVYSQAENFDVDSSIKPFVYEVSGNDDPIDIDSVVKWYSDIDLDRARIALRNVAINRYSWINQMGKVFRVCSH